MYPLDLSSSLSDSPVIILSPHQHQFDPISRAAHSIYRPSIKPVMDRRPYDINLGKGNTRKRGQDDLEEHTAEFDRPQPTSAPNVSPETGSAMPKIGPEIPLYEPNNPLRNSFSSEKQKKRNSSLTTGPEDDDEDPPSPRAVDNGHRRKVSRNSSASNIGDTLTPLTPMTPLEPQSTQSNPMEIKDGEAAIDPYKIALGVSWASIANTPEVNAAMRGNATFIERYHGLACPRVVAQNSEREQVLVTAADGWYLFSDNLRYGKLLSIIRTQALSNLASIPTVFEGKKELVANVNPTTEPPSQVTGSSDLKNTQSPRSSDDGMFAGPLEMDGDVEMAG